MLPLSLMNEETAEITIDGMDKLGKLADSHVAILGELTGLVAVILIFGTPVLIVLAVLRHRTNRQKLINEMVVKLAEKGQAIPPEVFMEPAKRRSELRTALSLIGIGLGLVGFFFMVGTQEGAGVGLIPLAIGVGQLIAWKIERRDKAD